MIDRILYKIAGYPKFCSVCGAKFDHMLVADKFNGQNGEPVTVMETYSCPSDAAFHDFYSWIRSYKPGDLGELVLASVN